MYFYDVSDPNNTLTRVDRDNGQYDKFCGPAETPSKCSHFVVNGERYIYYPEHDDCCFCCDNDHGCGALTTDWMKDATYVGQKVVDG